MATMSATRANTSRRSSLIKASTVSMCWSVRNVDERPGRLSSVTLVLPQIYLPLPTENALRRVVPRWCNRWVERPYFYPRCSLPCDWTMECCTRLATRHPLLTCVVRVSASLLFLPRNFKMAFTFWFTYVCTYIHTTCQQPYNVMTRNFETTSLREAEKRSRFVSNPQSYTGFHGPQTEKHRTSITNRARKLLSALTEISRCFCDVTYCCGGKRVTQEWLTRKWGKGPAPTNGEFSNQKVRVHWTSCCIPILVRLWIRPFNGYYKSFKERRSQHLKKQLVITRKTYQVSI
jgi:hypothetical protein